MPQPNEPNAGARGQGHQPGGDQPRHGSDVGQQARDLGTAAAERVKDVATSAAEKARDFAHTAKEQATAGTAALGSGIRNLASSLRESAPHEGVMGTAASTLADTLERSGNYIENEGMSGLVEDMSILIRRNPIPAVLVGVGVGFLFAQMFRSER